MRTLLREEVVDELRKIIGNDLRVLANALGVTVFKEAKLNKGWAGHTLERHLGLGLSSRQAPNGESWELKLVPLRSKGEIYVVKETMAITMINAENVAETPFEKSHLLFKLRSLVICGRLFNSKEELTSVLISVGTFDLLDKSILEQVREDYEFVRKIIREKGFHTLSGRMGKLVQPRTKGPGHGSRSRAFYARTGFVKKILGLS